MKGDGSFGYTGSLDTMKVNERKPPSVSLQRISTCQNKLGCFAGWKRMVALNVLEALLNASELKGSTMYERTRDPSNLTLYTWCIFRTFLLKQKSQKVKLFNDFDMPKERGSLPLFDYHLHSPCSRSLLESPRHLQHHQHQIEKAHSELSQNQRAPAAELGQVRFRETDQACMYHTFKYNAVS